jgi:hypothetical protein
MFDVLEILLDEFKYPRRFDGVANAAEMIGTSPVIALLNRARHRARQAAPFPHHGE